MHLSCLLPVVLLAAMVEAAPFEGVKSLFERRGRPDGPGHEAWKATHGGAARLDRKGKGPMPAIGTPGQCSLHLSAGCPSPGRGTGRAQQSSKLAFPRARALTLTRCFLFLCSATEWKALYPPIDKVPTDMPQEWLDALRSVEARGLIPGPDVNPVATLAPDGS